MGNFNYINTFFDEVKKVCDAVSRERIDHAIEVLFDAWQKGSWVFVMGNGGSASTATHFAADLAKTAHDVLNARALRAISLFDNVPLVSAAVNDWGWENLYLGQLTTYHAGDLKDAVAIGISVHGGSGKDKAGAWSQNLLKALQYVKDKGGKTIGFSGFDGGPMKELVDTCVVVPVNSTPLVESFHVLLHHLVVFRLKEKIDEFKKSQSHIS